MAPWGGKWRYGGLKEGHPLGLIRLPLDIDSFADRCRIERCWKPLVD